MSSPTKQRATSSATATSPSQAKSPKSKRRERSDPEESETAANPNPASTPHSTTKSTKALTQPPPAAPAASHKIYSSLPLQIMIFLNERFFPIMWIILLAMLIYKGVWFPYVGVALPLEIFGLFPFAVLEAARLFLGNRGNKMEERGSFAIFLGLTLVTIFGYLFYGIWQTYVTIVDLVVCGIGLVFVVAELLSGIVQIISFHRLV
ncbi:Transmembrane protein 80 [Chytriomyces hyalinus]|nr:Transmembrane protein 80 [Chytriomyces hyalinus]